MNMHQIKLLSIGSLFLHLLPIGTIKYFDKKWNLLEHLMVISKSGELASDSINLEFPDSCLATNETSALRGTKLLASDGFCNGRAWSVNLWKLSTLNIMVAKRPSNESPAVEQGMGRCPCGCLRKVCVWMWAAVVTASNWKGKIQS